MKLNIPPLVSSNKMGSLLNTRWAGIIICTVLFILNLLLKKDYISSRDLLNDEYFTSYFAQFSFAEIWQFLSNGNNPPLFECLLHIWIQCFGISEISVRFLPYIFSAITPIVLFYIGKRHFNVFIGLFTSLVFSFSIIHFIYVEARVYTLFVLLTALSLWFYLNVTENPRKKGNICGLIIVNVILIYSHYFALFIPLLQVLSTLLQKEYRQKIAKPIAFIMICTFVLYLPQISVLVERFFSSAVGGTWVQAVGFPWILNMFYIFMNSLIEAKIWFLIISIFFIIQWYKKTKLDPKFKVILTWFLVPFCTMFFISWEKIPFNIPMFEKNYVLFTSIPLYLSIVFILYNYFSNKYLRILLPSLLIIQMYIPYYTRCTPPQIKKIVEKTMSISRNKIQVFLSSERILLYTYYYSPDIFKDPLLLKKAEDILYFPKPIHQRLEKENIYAINAGNFEEYISILSDPSTDSALLFCAYNDLEAHHTFFRKTLENFDQEFMKKEKIIYNQQKKIYQFDPDPKEKSSWSDDVICVFLYSKRRTN